MCIRDSGGGGAGAGQGAFGVCGPGGVRGRILRAGVDAEGALPFLVGGLDHDLDLNSVLLGEDQRCLEGEFGEVGAADLVTRPDRQLHKSGAGEESCARDRVVREPRVRAGGKAAGQNHSAVGGERHGRAEQGVRGLIQSEPGRVPGTSVDLEPVALVLEGVGGEVGVVRIASVEEGGPVDVHAARPQAGDGPGEGVDLVVAPARGRHEQARRALRAHRGERRVRAQLKELAHSALGQPGDPVREAHRLPDLPHPVGGGAYLLTRACPDRFDTTAIRGSP